MRAALIWSLLLAGMVEVASPHQGFAGVEVMVNGNPVPRYYHEGTTYIEALKGQEYAIRITNPLGVRVAVALSVDGLNTIDARHTEARLAGKWVLGPYESAVISGWQTSARHARRFFFTTEERSYGAWLGRTEDLGVISAAFFRERIRRAQVPAPIRPLTSQPGEAQSSRKELDRTAKMESSSAQANAPTNDEYAATGIGDKVRHDVQWVHLELEDRPFSTVNVRYEFRPALVKLGVLLPPGIDEPLARRERARGFREPSYCPEP